jgi:hypothetical protein
MDINHFKMYTISQYDGCYTNSYSIVALTVDDAREVLKANMLKDCQPEYLERALESYETWAALITEEYTEPLLGFVSFESIADYS